MDLFGLWGVDEGVVTVGVVLDRRCLIDEPDLSVIEGKKGNSWSASSSLTFLTDSFPLAITESGAKSDAHA